MGQMDGWASDSYMDLAMHTMWAASIMVKVQNAKIA